MPDPTPKRCVILALDRPHARGGVTRIKTWLQTAQNLGYDVEIKYVNRVRADLKPTVLLKSITQIVMGCQLVESVAASPTLLTQHFDSATDLTIVVTLRCASDAVLDATGDIVIDLVDDLARNYRGRSREASWLMRIVFAILAPITQRAQRTMLGRITARPNVHVCAAGALDATNLDVSWQPIPVQAASNPKPLNQRSYDVGFVGTMTYAPNVRAVSNLLRIKETLARRGVSPSFVVAGSGISRELTAQLTDHGVSVIPDPVDMATVLNDIKLFVAPLETATGIQIKLLEAGAWRCAIVATSATLSGFDASHPIEPATVDEFADRIKQLLDDPVLATRVAGEWAGYVATTVSYSAAEQRLSALIANG